ncbi:glycosyltransferase [Microbacterium sp. dk485]|uniref:glycosyltransferase family 2 protein n=1 Tax=Microbacterium sp. dk485 TaxID=2560021 RepID=UPI00143012A0|nr:glycosyltransferase [Microbacterium sp. dk485]
MSEHRVDVVVAVHNDARPVERAVASVLRERVPLRVLVVAHNVDPARITSRLAALADDPRVSVLALEDGVRSPANAFNHGVVAACADYVCIIGSDDELQAGALEAWVELGDRTGARAVVAPIVRDGGGVVPTPRIRPGRRRTLDADRDRLYERTAPLGLQRRAALGDLRYAEGLPRGVDQAYGLALWLGGGIVFDPTAPAYLEHADQSDRVTHVFGPLADDFAFLPGVLELLADRPLAVRRAVASKLLRVHLIPALTQRAGTSSLQAADLLAARAVAAQLRAVGPGSAGLLPRAPAEVLAALEGGASVADVAAVAGRSAPLWRRLVPARACWLLHRHAPLRLQMAAWFLTRRVRRAQRRLPSE